MKRLLLAIVQGWLQAGEDIIVGGQAVIEGVMMRSPNAYAVAVRKRNGEIVYKGEAVPKLGDKYPLLKLPVLRGAATLLYSMALGIKTLNYSATVSFEDLPPEEKDSAKVIVGHEVPLEMPLAASASKSTKEGMSSSAATATATGSIIFALFFNALIFIALPLLLTNMIFVYFGGQHAAGVTDASHSWFANAFIWVKAHLKPAKVTLAFNLVDGLIRMSFFLIMIYGFSRIKDIHRVFEYHGAEHKVVFTHEANMPLTVVNARSRRRQHPRCGTSFLMVVMLVSIVMFSVVRFDSLVLNMLVRLALIPVVAGLSYEVIRASATRRNQWFLKLITMPGLWLQNITTQEPSDDQLEVALFALEKSLALEPAAATAPVLQTAEPAVV